jgi:outer membrane protein assembly factor BamA
VTSDSRDNRFFPTQGSYAESVASRKDHVNVRIDCAVGPDDDAVYFRIGEAF